MCNLIVRSIKLEIPMPKIPPLLFATALALELVFCGTFVRDAAAQGAKWGVNDGLQQSATTYNDFGNWLGKPQQWNLTWADKQSTWQKQVSMFSTWMVPRLVLWHSAGRGITISMPMVIPGETLAAS